MAPSSSSSQSLDGHVDEKETKAHIETVHTKERVPGQSHYYEKDGLRTYGDDEDHDHEPKVSSYIGINFYTCFTSEALLWESQIFTNYEGFFVAPLTML